MHIFLTIWVGQLFSVMGSYLTAFALGVWVYEKTGSAQDYGIVMVCSILPVVLLSPVAGTLADRFNRRIMMLVADSFAALGTLSLVFTLQVGELQIWHIYLVSAVSATAGAIQMPAYSAAVAQLVPKEHLARANGLVHSGEGIAQLLSPIIAAFLMTVIGLRGIITIDLCSFVIAATTLVFVRIPDVVKENTGVKTTMLQEFVEAFKHLWARRPLFMLLLMFAGTNFLVGLITVVVSPLVLMIAGVKTLGTLQSFMGVGMLAGSLVMGAWGGPKRLIWGVYGSLMMMGTALVVGGFNTSISIWFFCGFAFFLVTPILNSCSSAIWQKKIPHYLQGRVNSLRTTVAWSSLPIAYGLGGWLADNVFEPLLLEGGPLVNIVGPWFGTGPGRGMGLLLCLTGVCTVIFAIGCCFIEPLRNLETNLPDVIGDDDKKTKAEEATVTPQPA